MQKNQKGGFKLKELIYNYIQEFINNNEEKVKKAFGHQVFEHLNFSSSSTNDLKFLTECLWNKSEEGKILVIIDQFEVIIDQFEEYKNIVIDEIVDAIQSTDLPVNFLLSVQANSRDLLENKLEFLRNTVDKFPYPDAYLELRENGSIALNDSNIQPQIYGIEYNIKEKEKDNLVDIILNDISSVIQSSDVSSTENGKNLVKAPYLQLVMVRFWKEVNTPNNPSRSLQRETYQETLGGAKKIIKRHFEEHIQNKLLNKEREIANYIFHHLITPSYAKIALDADDLLKYINEDLDNLGFNMAEMNNIQPVLAKLTHKKSRILKEVAPLAGRDKCRYEIYHDALAPAILTWRNSYLSTLRRFAIMKKLPDESLRQLRLGQDDLAALLSIEAYKSNKENDIEILDQVDDALRSVLSVKYFNLTLKGHVGGVTSVAFSPDGKLLASGSHDGRIYIWKLIPIDKQQDKHQPKYFLNDPNPIVVCSLTFHPNEQQQILIAGKENGNVELWNLKKNLAPQSRNQPDKILWTHDAKVTSVVFNGDGSILVSAAEDGTINILNLHQTQYPNQFWEDYSKLNEASLTNSILGITKLKIIKAKNLRKVLSLAFDPQKNRFASGHDDGTIWLWNWNPNNCNYEPTPLRSAHKKSIKCLAFSQDGKKLASGSEDKSIRLWCLDNKNQDSLPDSLSIRLGECVDMDTVNSVTFSSCTTLVSGGEDQKVRLWNVEKPNMAPEELPGRYFGISSVANSKDNWLAAGSWDYTVRLWNLCPPDARPKILKDNTGKNHDDNVMSVAYSLERKMLASASWDKKIRLWNLEQPHNPRFYKNLFDESHPTDRVWSVAFSPHGNLLASSGAAEDRTVRLWNLNNLDQPPIILEGAKDGVSSVAFNSDGSMLAVGIWDDKHQGYETVLLWNVTQVDQNCWNQRKLKTKAIPLQGHGNSITSLAFHPKNKNILAVAGNDWIIRLWDLSQLDWQLQKSNARFIPLEGHDGRVWSVAFSSDGTILASSGDDKCIRLWNLEDMTQLNWENNQFKGKSIVLKNQTHWIGSVAFSTYSRRLASASYDGTINIWDLRDSLLDWEQSKYKTWPIVLRGHKQSVTSVVFIPIDSDKELLASGSYDNTVQLWITSTDTLADMLKKQVFVVLTEEEWERFMSYRIPYPYATNS